MGLLLLDLDGTLVADALVEVDNGKGATKLERRQDELFTEPTLLPNRAEVIARAAEEDDSFAIVTNQGGVAWGYHTVAEVHQRIAVTLRQLDFFFGQPFSVHVAFDHPRATVSGFRTDPDRAPRRKPDPGMLLEARGHHDEALLYTLMVGDREEDREAAEAAYVDFAPAGEFFAL